MPELRDENPITNVGRCPRCGKTINLDSGVCIACGETFEPPSTTPPPEKPAGDSGKDPNAVKDPKAIFNYDNCRFCGASLPPGGTADGRCVACGARNETSSVGNCPKCGKYISLNSGNCVLCGATFTPPPEPGASSEPASDPKSGDVSTQPGDKSSSTDPATSSSGATPSGSTSQGSGTTSGGGTSTAASDPPFTEQGIIKGDKAADLLEQAGLAKVTRDADGKPIKIDEAFPGAFTNLGGQTVTIKTGESSGGGSGPDWVEEAKGKITGIAFKPTADGGIGEPVIVVNQSDSQWREEPASGGTSGTAPTSSTTGATTGATTGGPGGSTSTGTGGSTTAGPGGSTSSGSGGTPSSGGTSPADPVAEVRSRLDQIDSARAAYNIARAGLPGEVAMSAAQDLARDLGINPDDARKLLEMDDAAWAQQKFWAINSQNPAL